VQRQANLQNAPGSEYNYNNTAFMLLATVVERVSEMDFREYMEEMIFRPLEMNNTTIKTHQGQVIPNSSQGYASAQDGGYSYVTDFASAYGASGVNSTALDMTRWMGNFRDGTVGGHEAIQSMTTRGILTSGDTTRYGLGLGVREWRGQTLYTHNGGETSHRTFFGYFPEIDSGLFFSSNNPSFSLAMWTDFAGAFFEEFLEPDDTDPDDVKATLPDSLAEAEHAMPTAEQLKAIAGQWKFLAAPLMIVYSVEDGKLYAQATNQPRFEVKPTSDSTFTFVGVEASVTFHYEEDGSVEKATHHQGPDSPMEKVEPTELTGEQLMTFSGRYFNEELETMYTLKVDDGKLMAYHRRNEPFALTPVQEDEFAGGMWFLGNITFDRDPTGVVSGFMGSNGRTRDVWFRKLN
jgi:Beta-lactamase